MRGSPARRARSMAAFLAVTLVAIASCSGPTAPDVVPMQRDAVLVGAGDIANCNASGAALTANLLDNISGTVFTAGDNAYEHGSLDDYMRCYQPTWGRHLHRTLPSPGNHEYETLSAAGYFDYFGSRAGTRGVGYYSKMVGQWLLVSLNSNVDASTSSGQVAWLRSTLDQFQGRCVVAIWHHPVTSSGPNGGSREMVDVWRILYEAGADVVINGHEHLYERYTTLDADHRPVPRGMRQFVVGTGGAEVTPVRRLRPGSEVQAAVSGVLKLTLRADSYDWEFVPVEGMSFRDSGHDTCR